MSQEFHESGDKKKPKCFTRQELQISVIDGILKDSSFLKEHVRVHFIGLKKFKRTIRGKRILNWMLDTGQPRSCNSREAAMEACNALLNFELVQHVKETRRQKKFDAEEIYQFSDAALDIKTTDAKQAYAQRRSKLTVKPNAAIGEEYYEVLEMAASPPRSSGVNERARISSFNGEFSDDGTNDDFQTENPQIRQLLEATQRLTIDVHDLKNPGLNAGFEEVDMLRNHCVQLQAETRQALEEMWNKLAITIILILLLHHFELKEAAVAFLIGVFSGCTFRVSEQPWRAMQQRIFVHGSRARFESEANSSLIPAEMKMMATLSPRAKGETKRSVPKNNTGAEVQGDAAAEAAPPIAKHVPEYIREMIKARGFFENEQKASAEGQPPLVHPIYPGVDPRNKGGNCWSQPEAKSFNVRGKFYLKDGRKVKSQPALFSTMALELSHLDDKVDHVASIETSARGVYHKELIAKGEDIPENCGQAGFLFIVSFLAPGYMCTIYFKRREPKTGNYAEEFERNLQAFCNTQDKKYRDKRLKIIPRVMEGGFVVRKTVGGKPGILANFMKTEYYLGPGYLEVDIDISSSGLAKRVMGVVKKVARQIVMDLGFTIQGNSNDMLPEVVLGSVRLHKIQIGKLPQFNLPQFDKA